MADFDLDQYLSKLIAEDNGALDKPPSPAPISKSEEKQLSLIEASKRKILQLGEDISNIKVSTNKTPPPAMTLIQGVNKVMGTDPVLDNPESFTNTAINTLARVVDSGTRFTGSVASMLPASMAADSFSKITPQDIADYRHITSPDNKDNLDPDAVARLNAPMPKRRVTRGMVTPNQNSEEQLSADPTNRSITTKKDLIENFLSRQDDVRKITDFFDNSSIVDRTVEKRLADNSTKDVEKVQAKYADAQKEWDAGNKFKAALGMVGAAASDVSGTIGDFVNTPEAIPAAVASNAAQMGAGLLPAGLAIQAAGNFGNSAQLVAEGIKNHADATGEAIPSYEQLTRQYGAAVAAAMLETVGDKIVNGAGLGAVKSSQALKASLLKKASLAGVDTSAIQAMGVGDILKSTAKVIGRTAEGTTAEGFTEHFQSPLENIAANKPYDAVEQRVSAVMGMGGGAGMSGTGAVISSVADKATQLVNEKNAKEADALDFYTAVKANDPSVYLDPASKAYNPARAAGVLFGHAQQDGVDPGVKAGNLAQINQVGEQLQTTLAQKQEELSKDTPEGAQAISQKLMEAERKLSYASPDEVAGIEQEIARYSALQAKQPLNKAELAQLNSDIAANETQIKQVQALAARLKQEVDAATVASTESTATSMSQDSTTVDPIKTGVAINQSMSSTSDLPTSTTVDASLSGAQAAPLSTPTSTVSTDSSTQLSQSTLDPKGDFTDSTVKPEVVQTVPPAKTVTSPTGLPVEITQHSQGGSVLAPDADAGAILYTAKPTQEGAAPVPMVLAKDGRLISASAAVNDGVSTAKAWIPPNQQVADEVRGLLEQRAQTEPNTPERQAINETIAQVVKDAAPQEDMPGKLGVFSQEASKEGSEYRQRNLFTDFFTQSSGKKDAGSLRPLVMAKDFLSGLVSKAIDASQFLKGETLTQEQQRAIDVFVEKAQAWNPIIQSALFKRKDPEYYYKDPLQFLYTEVLDAKGKPTGKFDVDENFKTAISFATFSIILDMQSKGERNDAKTINKMLGRDENTPVSDEEYFHLANAGTRGVLLRNAAGRVAYEALGLKANPEATLDLEPKIKAALGAHVEKLLLELGYITRSSISAKLFTEMMNKDRENESATSTDATNVIDEEATLSFFRLNREMGEVKQVADSVKQSQSVLDKLFSVESLVKMPSLKPIPYRQNSAQNTDREVPSELAKIIKQKQKEENKLRQDSWHIVAGFTQDFFLKMAGFEEVSAETTHISRRMGLEAKNDSLVREYENYLALGELLLATGDKSLDQPFFLEFSVWKNHRVGISTNGFNPQASKMQRHLSYQPAWETKVSVSDQAQMDNFMLRVAEGMGIKTDAQAAQNLLPSIRERMAQSDIQNAVRLLEERLVNPERAAFTDAEQEVIAHAVKLGGENLHSLNSLIALAQMNIALKNKAEDFTVQIPAEVDGKTNGSILATMLFGAASSQNELFETLNRGGIYREGSNDTQFNLWKEQGNRDLYENTIANTFKNLQALIAEKKVNGSLISTIQSFTNSLVNPKTGKVETAGRKIIKGPTTEIVFGSSLNKTVDNMSERFIESVYARIEDVVAGRAKDLTLDKLILELNTLLGKRTFAPNTTAQQLLDYSFKPGELVAMKEAFVSSLGQAVKATIKGDFADFLGKRSVFTSTAQLSYSLYDAAHQAMREAYMKELIAAGKIAVSKRDGVPIHDLNSVQKKEFQERIKGIYPTLHSLLSKESKQDGAALFMGKSQNKISDKGTYSSEVQFATPVKDTNSARINSAAMERVNVSPGVAMAPLSIHSLDSYISHMVQSQMPLLNVHDAVIGGVGSIQEAAQKMNAATWDALFKYSPASEMYEGLLRTLTGMQVLVTQDASPALINALAKSVIEQAQAYNRTNPKNKIDPTNFLTVQLGLVKAMAYSADSIKFTAMSQLSSIDQYTFEGGAHSVTDQQRADAKAALEALVSTVPVAQMQAVEALEAALQPAIVEQMTKAKEEARSVQDTLEVVDTGLTFSNAQSFHLLDHAVKDKTLDEKLVAKLKEVFRVMREAKGNMSINQAMAKVLDVASQAQVAQLLTHRFNQIPANLWGEQGKALIESDPEWVAFFDKRGNVTGKQLVAALRSRIERDGGPKNVRDFNLEMLNRIQGLINPNLTIRYVTPATASEQVIQAAKDNARAWFIATEDGVDVIYVLSPDFLHSGIQSETLLHELLHSAVARTIQQEREAMAANPKRNTPVGEIIKDLDNLRTLAAEFIAKDERLTQLYGPAVSDVDELIAWGMTNTGFQQEVLAKIQMNSRTNKTSLIDGLKVLLDSMVAILFRKTNKTEQEVLATGLSVLVTNVSELFTEAAKTQSQAINQTLNQSQKFTSPDPAFYTTEEIYNSLANFFPAPVGFDAQLRGVLGSIVDKLHGPAGAFHADLMKRQALSPRDVYLKALDTGKAPFASRVMSSGFKVSEQEGFVIEQVEATVRAAIERNENTETFAYKELARLFQEAQTTLKAEHFYDGDWSTASPMDQYLAEQRRSFLLDMKPVNGDRSEHLSRFAAMGLAHNEVSLILGFSTQPTPAAGKKTIFERLRAIFESILDWFHDRGLKTVEGEQANDRLYTLVDHLVGIEAKKKASAMRQRNATFEAIEKATDKGISELAAKVEKFGESNLFQKSKNGYIRGLGGAISAVAGNRVDQMIEDGLIFKDKVAGSKPNVLTQTVGYMRGPLAQFEELFRLGKKIEADRKRFMTQTAKNVLAGFANNGQHLTMAQKEAVSAVFLRGDIQSLLIDHSLAEIAGFLDKGPELAAKIKELEAKIDLHPAFTGQFLQQARALGYKMATGENTIAHMMLNANNIARGFGSRVEGKLTEEQVAELVKNLDPLISLYAIQYMPTRHRTEARGVLLDELARPNGENGIAVVLKMHQYLLKDSKDKLFDGSDALIIKGYTPEVYNPRTDIVVANEKDGETLQNNGYVKGEKLYKDLTDPDKTEVHLYYLHDGGLVAHPSGMLSQTGQSARGSKQIGENRDMDSWSGQINVEALNRITDERYAQIKDMPTKGAAFDPTKVRERFMVPLLNSKGEVVNYRYTMTEARKNTVLERKNHFEHLLGVMAGNTFDKVASTEHNKEVIQALHDHYKVDFAGRAVSYVEVGPNSRDPEMREVYRLLPDETKRAIERIWGTEGMMVRNDMLHLAFGYRKYSLSNIFEKTEAERSAIENLFASSVEFLLANHARVALGMTPDRAAKYAQRAGHVVRQGEEMWKFVSDTVKNNIVVKTGVVLLGNVWSNTTLLMMHGISLTDIAHHHTVAYKAARRYQEDSEELYKLQTQLNSGLTQAKQMDVEQRILTLKNEIARNPVTELMNAGLMPTIVQDVNFDEELYSYKPGFEQKIDAALGKVNPTVMKVAKQVYMTKDTPHYKLLSEVTQLSDFVARYTLYMHMTTRQKEPMSKKQAMHAAAETFVNYDIPLPPSIQYLDDMGLLPFTKYFLSIQRVIYNLVREHPVRALMVLAGNNYFHMLPTVLDGSMFDRFGHNPFYSGPFRILNSFGKILPIKYGLSLFR